MEQPEKDNVMDFLITDLKTFGDALSHNEDRGEKRINFFITLVTAIIAGLVALHTKGRNLIDECTLNNITNGSIAGLVIFGLMTYLRMLHRNRVTDQFKRTLDYIRGKLLEVNPHLKGYEVPQSLGAGKWKYVRGGLAETVGAMNAVLLCALLIINSVPKILVGVTGLFVLIISWVLAAKREGLS